MRFLADENIPRAAVAELRRAGHNVLWASESMAGARDRELLRLAEKEHRVILTLDKDFGDLVRLLGLDVNAGVVLFRLSFPSPGEAARKIGELIGTRDDWVGHFSVVKEDSLRIMPLVTNDSHEDGQGR